MPVPKPPSNLKVRTNVTQGSPLHITTPPTLPGGVNGTVYSAQLAAIGGVGPYTWLDLSDSGSGLILSSLTGFLSGNPNAGAWVIQIAAQDATGASSPTVNFTITVIGTTLVISTVSLPAATVGVAYNSQLAATGGVPPYTFSLPVNPLFNQPQEAGIIFSSSPGSIQKKVWTMDFVQGNQLTPLVVATVDISAKTGFAPVNKSTAQVGYLNAVGHTIGQMEGSTVGAYLNTNDLPVSASDQKLMITPEYRWILPPFTDLSAPTPFFNASAVLNGSLDLQIPLCAGGNDVFINLGQLFTDPNGIQVTYNVGFFHNNLANPGQGLSFDAPTQNYIITSNIGVNTLYLTQLAGSSSYSPTTWSGFRHFAWTISSAQFQAALHALDAAFPGVLTTFDPSQYRLSTTHLNAEIHTLGSSATIELGWSMQNYTLSVTEPSWMSCSASGLLTGTPTIAETELVTPQVTDSVSNTATKAFSLQVNPASGTLTFTLSGVVANGNVITVTANQPFFPTKSFGSGFPQVFDTMSQQYLNGVAQNSYAGLTDGQSIAHLFWGQQSSDNGAPPTSYYTSRPTRTPFDTAVVANVNMNSTGKGFIGVPPWPAAYGTQNNQTLYFSYWGKAKNTAGAAGGGDTATKMARVNGLTDTSANIAGWGRGLSELQTPFGILGGSYGAASQYPGGQWVRVEMWFDYINRTVELWLNGHFQTLSFSGVGGIFEYAKPANVLYTTNLRTDTYWAPELFGDTITAVNLAGIGWDDGHGLSVGNDFDFAQIYVDPDIQRPELANTSSTWDVGPSSTMQRELQGQFQVVDSQTLKVTLSQGAFSSLNGLGLWWATGRNTAQLLGTLTQFDFFVSPTGNDANAGTLASPWAITSLTSISQNANNVANFNKTHGKKIGIMPGTYNVSAMVLKAGASSHIGPLQIDGGTAGSPTVYAACDASGNYLGTAAYNPATGMTTSIITAKNGSGQYYNGATFTQNNGAILTHLTPAHLGNITLDGLTFTGGTYKGVRIGGSSSNDGSAGITGVTIQNCVVTDMSCAGLSGDNFAMLWIDGCINPVVQNNYIHDNQGSSGVNNADHLAAVYIWGPSVAVHLPYASGALIQNNTVIHSGMVVWGKIGNQQQATVQANYLDASMYTVLGFNSGIFDFMGYIEPSTLPNPAETGTNTFRNNILVVNEFVGIGRNGNTDTNGYLTPLEIYNNTLVMGTTAYPAFWTCGNALANGGLKIYNNVYTGHADTSGKKSLRTNPAFPALIDYNMHLASGMTWALTQNGALDTNIGTYTTIATFAAALSANGGISGAEAHSILATPTFTATGTAAQQYQLTAASAGHLAGKVGGVTAGAACDMGAWGNLPAGVTSVGASIGP